MTHARDQRRGRRASARRRRRVLLALSLLVTVIGSVCLLTVAAAVSAVPVRAADDAGATITVTAASVDDAGHLTSLGSMEVEPGPLDATTLSRDGYTFSQAWYVSPSGRRLPVRAVSVDPDDPATLVLVPQESEAYPDQDDVELTLPVAEAARLTVAFVPTDAFLTVAWSLPEGVSLSGNGMTSPTRQVLARDGQGGAATAVVTLSAPMTQDVALPSPLPAGVGSVRLVEDRSTSQRQVRVYELVLTDSATVRVTAHPKDGTATLRGEVVSEDSPRWASAPYVSKYWSSTQRTRYQPLSGLHYDEATTVYFDFTGARVISAGVTPNYFLNAVDVNGDVLVVPDPPVMLSAFTGTAQDFRSAYQAMRAAALGPLVDGPGGVKVYSSRQLVSKTFTEGPNAGTTITVSLANIRALSDRIGSPLDSARTDVYGSMQANDPASYVYLTRYVVSISGVKQRENVVRARFLPSDATSVISMGATGLTDGSGRSAVEVATSDPQGWTSLCAPGARDAACRLVIEHPALAPHGSAEAPTTAVRMRYAPGYGAPVAATTCPDGTAADESGCYGVALGQPMGALWALPRTGTWTMQGYSPTYTSDGWLSVEVPYLGYRTFSVGDRTIGAGVVEPLLSMASAMPFAVLYRDADTVSAVGIADQRGLNVRRAPFLTVPTYRPTLADHRPFVGWDLEACASEDGTGICVPVDGGSALQPGASLDLRAAGIDWWTADGGQAVRSFRLTPAAVDATSTQPLVYVAASEMTVDGATTTNASALVFQGADGLTARLSAAGRSAHATLKVNGVTGTLKESASTLSAALGPDGGEVLRLVYEPAAVPLQVTRHWQVNGVALTDTDLAALDGGAWAQGVTVRVNDKPLADGQTLSGWHEGDTANLAVTISTPSSADGCTVRAVSVTGRGGSAVPLSLAAGEPGTTVATGTVTVGTDPLAMTLTLACTQRVVVGAVVTDSVTGAVTLVPGWTGQLTPSAADGGAEVPSSGAGSGTTSSPGIVSTSASLGDGAGTSQWLGGAAVVWAGRPYSLAVASPGGYLPLRIERYVGSSALGVPSAAEWVSSDSTVWEEVATREVAALAPGQTVTYRVVTVPVTTPTLPLTGGVGRDAWLVLGVGVLGTAVVMALVERRSRASRRR